MKMRKIGVILIVVGIIFSIAGGIIEIGVSRDYVEETKGITYERTSTYNNVDTMNGHYTEKRNVTGFSSVATWAESFGQLVVFAGIGFILFDIATGKDGSVSKKEELEDDTERPLIDIERGG